MRLTMQRSKPYFTGSQKEAAGVVARMKKRRINLVGSSAEGVRRAPNNYPLAVRPFLWCEMKEILIPAEMRELGAATNTACMSAFAAQALEGYALDSYWLMIFDDDLRLAGMWKIRDGLVDRLNAFSGQLRRLLWRAADWSGGYVIVRHSPGSQGILSPTDRKIARFYAKESDSQEAYLQSGKWLDFPGQQRDVEMENRFVKSREFFYGILVLGSGGSHVHYSGSE